MRTSPAIPYVLAAAGLVQAFPFVAGRSMEYSVIRRGGAERSIVTLVPVGSLPDSNEGKKWKFQVTDTLLSGTRKDGSSQRMLTSELEMHVEAAYMAWTTLACEIPWDVASPQVNPIPIANRPWGARALICAGGAATTGNTVQTTVSGRSVSQPSTCDPSSTPCVSVSRSWGLPLPEGLWSNDSGWISYQDGVTGDSWTLRRLGNGKMLGDVRGGRGIRIMDVRKQDKWTFSKTLDWRSVKLGVGKNDTLSGIDSTIIVWTALERIGNIGQVGTWKVRRLKSGHETDLDTIEVDFDSPLALVEERSPSDLPLTVFRRQSWPPFEESIANNSYAWSNQSVATGWTDAVTLDRSYAYSDEGEFQKMVQTYRRRSQGYLVDPESDSTTTMELVEFMRSLSSGVQGRDAGSMDSRAPRTLDDLERLVAMGGRILSIRDVLGVRLGGTSGAFSEVLRKERGVLLVEVLSPEGHPLQARILKP